MASKDNFEQSFVKQRQLMEYKNTVDQNLANFSYDTKSALFKFESRFQNIDSQFAKAAAERHKILEIVELQRAEHLFLVDSFDRLEKKFDLEFSDMRNRMQTIEGDVSNLKTDVAQLKTDMAEVKADIAELKIGLKDVQQSLIALTETVQMIALKL